MQLEWVLEGPQWRNMNFQKSCDYCRKNHIKCDSRQPCSNCVARGVSCVYSPKKKRATKFEKQLEQEMIKLKGERDRLLRSEQYWKQKVYNLNTTKRIKSEEEVVKEPMTTNKILLYAKFLELLEKGLYLQEPFPSSVLMVLKNH